jgi:hypothetical protein
MVSEERKSDIEKVESLPPFGGKCLVFWHEEDDDN